MLLFCSFIAYITSLMTRSKGTYRSAKPGRVSRTVPAWRDHNALRLSKTLLVRRACAVPEAARNHHSDKATRRRYVLLFTQRGGPFPPLVLYTDDRERHFSPSL